MGLCAVGIAPGETVAIIGENCLPWLAADLATLAGGFPNVVLAPSLSDVMFVKVLGHAQCRAAFVQNAAVAGRLVKVSSWYDNEWGFSNRMLDTAVALMSAR